MMVSPGAAFSTSSCTMPAQDGVWRELGVLPYSWRLVPQRAMRAPKRYIALSPTPSPEGPSFGRVECAADVEWGARLRLSADSPRPSSKFIQHHSQLARESDLALPRPRRWSSQYAACGALPDKLTAPGGMADTAGAAAAGEGGVDSGAGGKRLQIYTTIAVTGPADPRRSVCRVSGSWQALRPGGARMGAWGRVGEFGSAMDAMGDPRLVL